jgi:hypothetical protein
MRCSIVPLHGCLTFLPRGDHTFIEPKKTYVKLEKCSTDYAAMINISQFLDKAQLSKSYNTTTNSSIWSGSETVSVFEIEHRYDSAVSLTDITTFEYFIRIYK